MSIDRRAFLKAAALTAVPVVPATVEPTSVQPASALYGENEHRHDLPEEVDLLNLTNYTALACEAMLQAHGEDCGCFLCDAVRGLQYNLEVALSCLESNLFTHIGDVTSCPCCGQPWNDEAEAA